MTFHIIYTSQSVKYLLHFVESFIDNSSYRFCLVSNGCLPKERALLKKVSEQYECLSYYCYPTHHTQIHGRVLTHLQAMCQEQYFCFMDSDIFATGPLPNLEELIKKENLTGLFSAMPIWVKQSEYVFKSNFKIMAGTYNQMQDGTCIGSTYFAIYKNEHLNQIIQHYGISFEECVRLNLPIEIQQELQKMGYHQTIFDTAKVINLLLKKHQLHLKNLEIPQLCHIGGTSYATNPTSSFASRKKILIQKIKNSHLKIIWTKLRAINFKQRFKNVSKEEYQINYNQRILYRNITRQHFLKLYQALKENGKLPQLPVFKDKEISDNLTKAHQKYIEAFMNKKSIHY